MKKKNKGNYFEFFALFVAVFSLGFNILLLYGIKTIPKTNTPVETNTHVYSKKELGEYFKSYQSNAGLATPDLIVLWDVDKVTYRGFFKNTEKKLYYFTEKFTCVNSTSCITASGVQGNTSKDNYDYIVTFVVSVDFTDKYDLKFEILDYSIEESNDFIQDEIYDLE